MFLSKNNKLYLETSCAVFEGNMCMGVIIDESIIKCVRGVYGIFIEKDGRRTCEYVGKSEEVKIWQNMHIETTIPKK